jgi:predicted restriction endonuclease
MPGGNTWQQWLPRLYNLRRDKRGTHERPHKPVLLLSILDLLDKGHLKRNEVPLNDVLIKTFRQLRLSRHQQESPWSPQPALP